MKDIFTEMQCYLGIICYARLCKIFIRCYQNDYFILSRYYKQNIYQVIYKIIEVLLDNTFQKSINISRKSVETGQLGLKHQYQGFEKARQKPKKHTKQSEKEQFKLFIKVKANQLNKIINNCLNFNVSNFSLAQFTIFLLLSCQLIKDNKIIPHKPIYYRTNKLSRPQLLKTNFQQQLCDDSKLIQKANTMAMLIENQGIQEIILTIEVEEITKYRMQNMRMIGNALNLL